MSARTLDQRGYDVGTRPHDTDRREHLRLLAEQFPQGFRVAHVGGREGTVVPDQPGHVPGAYYDSTTVCLGGEFHNVPMVFVSWDNEADLVWRAWVPAAQVRRRGALAVNRPGNRATAAPRKAVRR
ncbi:hypothetical protein [Streptomyces sp. NPDC056160]|uniref:hypothetical protein n=1 Tax=Streptomyces sp. NPDC056160 TaxID=3345731 RepID=UPI0035DE35B2